MQFLLPLHSEILRKVGFPGLKDEIKKVCAEEYLVCGEGDEQGCAWMEKVMILF